MKMLALGPTLYSYDDCAAFCSDFAIGPDDLLVTNRYTYGPFFEKLGLGCQVLFQENYGTGEPTDIMADAMLADIKGDPKRVIAVGGGTVIDICKLFALKDAAPVDELFRKQRQPQKARQLVLVPTTCGTGSEVTNISILMSVGRGVKGGLASDALLADSAVLIPQLLQTLPYPVFAASSIDALIHAMESMLSPKTNAYTELFALQAIQMILTGYLAIEREGQQARLPCLKEYLIASNYAGIAFGNAGVGAVHAMSYPLGATYHVPHGEANYAILPGVLRRYNEISPEGKLLELKAFVAGIIGGEAGQAIDRLDKLMSAVLKRKPLREYGVTGHDLQNFTHNVMTEQTRLTANNYVPLGEKDVLEIYRALL